MLKPRLVTKFTENRGAFWFYLAGRNAERRDHCMQEARKAKASGDFSQKGKVSMFVEFARNYNQCVIEYLDYAFNEEN